MNIQRIRVIKKILIIIIVAITLYFADKNIRSEFYFINFPILNIGGYLFFTLLILFILKSIVKKWLIYPILFSVLIFSVSFLFSGSIAKKLNNYNKNKIEQLSNKNNYKRGNFIFFHYGIYPSIYKYNGSNEITIPMLHGLIQTYNIKARSWKTEQES
jgi:hypothetical protein